MITLNEIRKISELFCVLLVKNTVTTNPYDLMIECLETFVCLCTDMSKTHFGNMTSDIRIVRGTHGKILQGTSELHTEVDHHLV